MAETAGCPAPQDSYSAHEDQVGKLQPTYGEHSPEHRSARKPVECLEYILAHELAHLKEPNHGPRFAAILDNALPQWREVRGMLNDLPLGPADRGQVKSPRGTDGIA